MKTLVAILIATMMPASAVLAGDLKPWTGGETPPLVLNDLKGTTHNLEDYRGKVVMVQFWATYCPPCIKEMPSMQRLQAKLAGRPFVILAVNMGETEQEVRDFLKKVNVDFTILMDNDGKSLSRWKVFVAPSTFLINPKGDISYSLQGGADWDAPDYVQAITDLMGAK